MRNFLIDIWLRALSVPERLELLMRIWSSIQADADLAELMMALDVGHAMLRKATPGKGPSQSPEPAPGKEAILHAGARMLELLALEGKVDAKAVAELRARITALLAKHKK